MRHNIPNPTATRPEDLDEQLSEIERLTMTALAPCMHPIKLSECIGGPNAQNLWKCGICGNEWLR